MDSVSGIKRSLSLSVKWYTQTSQTPPNMIFFYFLWGGLRNMRCKGAILMPKQEVVKTEEFISKVRQCIVAKAPKVLECKTEPWFLRTEVLNPGC